MGWGRMLLLGNWGQQMDIEDQRAEIARLRSTMHRARGSGAEVARLRKELDEAQLYSAALMRLLVLKGTLTYPEIRAMVEAIDAEDGVVDGKSGGIGG